MKKGPLSKKEKAHILKNYLDTPAAVMAEEMDRSVHMVDKFIAKQSFAQKDPEPEPEPVEQKEKPKTTSQAFNLLARDKNRGVVVMTEASSMESDKNKPKPKQPKRYRNIIHKIKED